MSTEIGCDMRRDVQQRYPEGPWKIIEIFYFREFTIKRA